MPLRALGGAAAPVKYFGLYRPEESGKAKRGCAPPAATGCAHSGQNFAVGESGVQQFEQTRESGVAHSSQNSACGRFSYWHRGHLMRRASHWAFINLGEGESGVAFRAWRCRPRLTVGSEPI